MGFTSGFVASLASSFLLFTLWSSSLWRSSCAATKFVDDPWSMTCEAREFKGSAYEPILTFKAPGEDEVTIYIGDRPRPEKPADMTVEVTGTGASAKYEYKIPKLAGDNGGHYKCDTGVGEKTQEEVTVIWHELECPTVIPVVTEGETLQGLCKLMKRGNDNIVVRWKNGDQEVGSVPSEGENFAGGNLNLVATSELNEASVTCAVDIPDVKSCDVKLSVKYPPKNVTLYPMEQRKKIGSEAKVTCEASDANPLPIAVAFKVSRNDGDFEDADPASVTGKVLTLTVDADYGVRCTADNGVGIVTNSSETARIYQLIPAKITGDPKQSPDPGVAGKTLNVTCPVEPDLAKVTWYKNKVEADNKLGNGKLFSFVPTKNDNGVMLICHAVVADAPEATRAAARSDGEVDIDEGVEANITLSINFPVERVSSSDDESRDGVLVRTIVYEGNPAPKSLITKVLNGTANITYEIEGTEIRVRVAVVEKDLPVEFAIYGMDADGDITEIGEGKNRIEAPETTEKPQESDNAGTIAGVIIAIILIIICALLLVVMWKKNLLCPKKQGSLEVEKGTSASSDGGISKPVDLEEVKVEESRPVESEMKPSEPLLEDDDIKKPPVTENGRADIIPIQPPTDSKDLTPVESSTPPRPPPPIVYTE